MRMQHWSKWVMALLVNAACVATSHAQDYPVDVTAQPDVYQASAGETVTTGTAPAVESADFAGYSNAYGAYPVQPWPEVSPYDYSFDQTYYEDGLWYRRTNRRQTEYFMEVDFFNAKIKRPDSGAPQGIIGLNSMNERTAYAPLGRLLVGVPEDITAKQFRVDGTPLYAPHFTEELGSSNTRPGLKARFGAINADDSGWELAGFWAPNHTISSTAPYGTIDRSFDGFASVGEDGADFIDDFFFDGFPDNGYLVFSDSFNMAFQSSAWSAEANMLTTPIGTQNDLGQFTAIFGVRYLGISEQFSIDATDSGYTAPIVGLVGRVYLVDPHTMTLDSKLQSHLVGPQVGMRWAIGGDSLKLTTEVKGAFTANIERRKLSTDNYGITTTLDAFPLFNGDPTSSRETKTDTNFAPIFEVNFMAELGLMQNIPVLNKLPGLRDSKFRIGYSYTQAWQIARAASSVRYDAPLPKLQTDRESWHVGGLVAGFLWTH